MKKIIALLLVLCLSLALFACGSKDKNTPTPPAPDTPTASTDTGTPPELPTDSTAGYASDDVDWFARDKYHFVYAFTAPSPLVDTMMNAWKVLGNVYNFDVAESTGNGDAEAYVQNLEVMANQGNVDGFFMDCDPTIQNRVIELLDEFNLPFVCMFNPMYDSSGAAIAPTLALDQYQSGYDSLQWLIDNQKTYWPGDVDPATIGLLNLDWSTSPPLHDRCVGATDAFKKAFPGNTNIFDADGVTAGNINAEVGYNLTSQIVAAHTEIKYWFADACVEDFAQGAARYFETLTTQDNILLTDVGSVMLAIEWDSGYDGAWKACYAISDYAYAGPAALGLIALADGRATPATLWPERRAAGDKATIWIAESSIVTKDTYKEYLTGIDKKYGAQ
ncbi:MAG: hypothetical protein LBO63_06710 [Oscillospiraceae bacterium]|jgi:ABC-type sugar transport system substrate-binding protein|nr:hypothetical protein [Oscillospiraceae bacterium]